MNAERLLALYENVAEAPDAIARLRRFVLNLAVRGKLVAQEAGEEPASELLKQIAAEKAQSVKAGEIKKPKCISLSDNAVAEIPYNWALVPLGEVILKHLGGGTPSKSNESYWNGELRWASVKDVGKSKYLDDTIDRITEAGLASSSSNLIEAGNLLVVTRMGLGKISINRIPVAINQDLRALFLSQHVSIDYAYNFFLTHGFEGTGLTVKGIKLEELLRIPFPLPPLAEQRRIVAKVEELMALLDRMEGARTAREATRDRLTAASFARLTAPDTDPADFPENARFALATLPALTTRPNQIKPLRQTILNLAVRGKLVDQDPAGEPALKILAQLARKKAKHWKGRNWSNGEAPTEGLAFEAPSGWAWTTIDQTALRVTVGHVGPMKDKYVEEGIPFLRSQNVRANAFRPDGLTFISPEFHQKIIKSALAPGDVVVVRSGNVGTACVIPPELPVANCSDLVVVQSPEAVIPEYLCFYLNSLASVHIEAGTVGVALTHFNTKSVATMPFPLPPLAEQQRIVAKVDALMALCDRLEAALTTADTTRVRLLDALLNETLAPVARTMAAAE